MLAVFVGKNADGTFRKTVCSILRRYIGTLELSSKKVFEVSRQGTKIALYFTKSADIIKTTGALVFLNSCPHNARILGEKALVFSSSLEGDHNLALKSSGEVISCGFSIRDSVTFSSCREEACVISVQRRFKRFDGSIKEPFEFPISCKKDDDRYGILAAAIILIFYGII